MDSSSRSKNFVLNVAAGYVSQIAALILSFIGRKIFIQFLPIELLGINGLYTNILTVLSLAETGLDSAFVYMLYKPISENNYDLIYTLLRYFKKWYYCISAVLMCISISLIPFLRFIVNIDESSAITDSELITYYILFLINTILPYLTAQYSILLSASQQARIKHNITLFCNVLLQLIHILVLVLFRNYYVYIISTICITMLMCAILVITTRRKFRRYFYNNKIVEFERATIKNKVLSTVMYKFGAVAVNNTDNILISVLVSTTAVGYYSNYCTISTSIQSMISIVSVSLLSGLGNLYATSRNSKEKQKLFFFQLFVYHTVAAVGFIGLFIMLDKFIALWLGSEFVLGKSISFAIAFNFYITNATGPIWINREANGLFEKVKYLMIVRALINLVLSIVLGREFGTFGILFATGLSIVFSSFWVEPKILFRSVFDDTPREYWRKQVKYFVVTMVLLFVFVLTDKFFGDSILSFVLEVITICVFSMSVFLLFVWKYDEGQFVRNRLSTIMKKA